MKLFPCSLSSKKLFSNQIMEAQEMFKKATILLAIILIGISSFLTLWLGIEPDRIAYANSPIQFHGDIYEFAEEFVSGGNEPPYVVTTMKAYVEASNGEFYNLIYTDKEPLAESPSDWKQFFIYPENSWWDFGDESHIFEATGQINIPAWAVFPPDQSEDNNGLLLARSTGVYDISNGVWGDTLIIGGRAFYTVTFTKEEYRETGGCHISTPCVDTVSGTIKGTIMVE